jgi:hypothetical protein
MEWCRGGGPPEAEVTRQGRRQVGVWAAVEQGALAAEAG